MTEKSKVFPKIFPENGGVLRFAEAWNYPVIKKTDLKHVVINGKKKQERRRRCVEERNYY